MNASYSILIVLYMPQVESLCFAYLSYLCFAFRVLNFSTICGSLLVWMNMSVISDTCMISDEIYFHFSITLYNLSKLFSVLAHFSLLVSSFLDFVKTGW